MIYALYHGDKFVDLGTKQYLAKLINVNINTISFYSTITWKLRTNFNSWVVIRIEED